MVINTANKPIQQCAQKNNFAVQIVGWFCLQYLCLKVLGRALWIKRLAVTLAVFSLTKDQ